MANANVDLSRSILKERGFATYAICSMRPRCSAGSNGTQCRKRAQWDVRNGDDVASDRPVCDEHLIRAALLVVAPACDETAVVAVSV